MLQPRHLTSEKLKEGYENPFNLVNDAIKVARHMVSAGHTLSNTQEKNSANLILKKMSKDKELAEQSEKLVEMSDLDQDLDSDEKKES